MAESKDNTAQATIKEAQAADKANASSTVELAKNVTEAINTAEVVVETSTYAGFQEWPKWLYHGITGEKNMYDSFAEFTARTDQADRINWTADPFASVADSGLLVSPATGGASDPALRAAAQPAFNRGGPAARLPEQAPQPDRLTMEGPRIRDPQRVQAVADSNSRARR